MIKDVIYVLSWINKLTQIFKSNKRTDTTSKKQVLNTTKKDDRLLYPYIDENPLKLIP